jgi:hypothetical protein
VIQNVSVYHQGAKQVTIIIEPYIIPEKGTVELKIERSFDIKVTAEDEY